MARLSQALTWLSEEPDHSFTLNMVFRRGWPGLADFLLLPKPWALGRAARTLERVLFLGKRVRVCDVRGLAHLVVLAGGFVESGRGPCGTADAGRFEACRVPGAGR